MAKQTVGKILNPTSGPYSNPLFLKSENGLRFLSCLAEADPGATMSLIEATVGQWPAAEVKELTTGRQQLVWTLEKIAVWTEYFDCEEEGREAGCGHRA